MTELINADTYSLSALAESVAEKPLTGVQRAAQIRSAITSNQIDELMGLQEKLNAIVLRIVANKIDPEYLGELDEDQLYDFMLEMLDQKDVRRLLEVRYEMMREALFAHITERNRQAGVHDPEHTPGEAPVPRLGKKFTREGGRMKAILDKDKLRQQLGEKRWAQVSRTEIVAAVPEHLVTTLDEQALVTLVQQDPSVMEIFRDCVTSGGYGVARLQLRELKGGE